MVEAGGGMGESADLDVRFDPTRGLMSVHVAAVGADLADAVRDRMVVYGADVTHVELLLDDPGVDFAVRALHSLGFGYCGLWPDFARSDVLRMQKVEQLTREERDPRLANPPARTLLATILAEHE